MPTIPFEDETCSRCGGSGHFSYCQRYGTTCFKCAGRGLTLTKRGKLAMDYFTRLLSVQAKDVKKGMKIRESGVSAGGDLFTKWATVVDVRYEQSRNATMVNGEFVQSTNQVLVIETDWITVHGVAEDRLYRVASDVTAKRNAAELAIAFQRSLNKQGKPDKTLAKIMKEVAY
jgi:hypothetical protein